MPRSYKKDHRAYEMDLPIIRNGIYIAQRYADEILSSHVVPHAADIGDSVLLIRALLTSEVREARYQFWTSFIQEIFLNSPNRETDQCKYNN